MGKALSFTGVFQANSLNYGEGIANISELKKFHRANGEVYTFASRQSLRYDIVRLGNQLYGWNRETVDKASGVIQFKKDVTIKDSVEMDLFGYLKTAKQSQKRPAVARLSHAISLEPYRSDMDFLNNMGLAERIGETPNLANIEQHESLYTYTLTLDLDRVGVDPNGEVELAAETKATRVRQLLNIMKILNREIRGRQENLAPLFVIGGVYDVANPFFLGKVKLNQDVKGFALDLKPIQSTMEQTFAGSSVSEQTRIGLISGIFDNEAAFRDAFGESVDSVESFFRRLAEDVSDHYGVHL
ncbi:type I-B CRISPR-associated protein Cas7/Cst2/DevR [Kroppenstedtia eburnea]|uniref:CRISPR-associated protein Cst2 n=1 Tax=Kroppenstedtia eburnea TaxID=714067 RepID=A0A1N7Q465_9BACL|nr:type I-B CRISPR-associated protein Cas7/Cst2/DevR [Kroppenstedtia eburnea]QKI82609.1 type I-B CRISPR-associated protein Cas7/Cst2/DevR [Kroppenstedtia eburnea]SIT17680.1 CRISPR-associated protein Cst2 [Kroppenstedtia eburnea]